MKLLRKDVLKWIRALQSGQYKKGKGKLVSENGTKFCCLGVWADMHGATWDERSAYDKGLVPIPSKGARSPDQFSSYLSDERLAKGLDIGMQKQLATMNDESNRGFKDVIAFIKKEVLPLAK